MRTVLAVTIALALCAPIAVAARGTDGASALQNLLGAYQQVHAVRVIEQFENGGVATVDVMPAGQYRIASTGGEDPALIIQLATVPVPNATSGYYVNSLGQKTQEGVKTTGYKIMKAAGGFLETVWMNKNSLPVLADVQTQGHDVHLLFGDYNDSMLVATPASPK